MMDKPYKLLVFDWDGTLADSLNQIVSAMQQASRALELEQRSAEQIRDIIGLGMHEALARLYPDLSAAGVVLLVERYRDFYLGTPAQTTALYPDAEQTLEQLHSTGYLLAVATGKSRRGLHRALQDTGIARLFHASCCADEAFSKPHPQMLEQIMDGLGVTPRDTLMIGDTEYDLQMANNAGAAAIAVLYGAHQPQRLLEHEPLACLHGLKDLPGWLAAVV
jgi:phosphoglycolate phosphatase